MTEINELDVNTATLSKIGGPPDEPNEPSLEQLTLLVIAQKVKQLNESSSKKLEDVTSKQKVVATLHSHLRTINTATEENGDLNLKDNQELIDILKKASDLGVELDPEKMKYTATERERLLENIRSTIEDHNVEINMGLQDVTRLHDERNMVYKMMDGILKALKDPKMTMARYIKS